MQSDLLPELKDISQEASPHEEKPKQEELIPEEEVFLKNVSINSFQILAENVSYFNPLKNIIKNAEDIVFEYMGLKMSANSINLAIISNTNKEYKSQFYADIYNDASIYLMLKWDENLEYDKLCNFIMGAILRKIILERNQKVENISYFLELGLATLLEQRTTKGLISKFAKETEDIKLLNLKESLNISRGDTYSKKDKFSAYWNLLALKKFYKDKTVLHSTIIKILTKNGDYYKGISTYTHLGEFEKYFRCIVNSELSSRLGGVMDMENSAEEILSLSFIRKDSTNQSIGDKAIFQSRDDEEILKAIKRRIMEIKLLLLRVNPIYFNALLSLGEMFESAENNDESDFENARQNFIGYFRQAKYLEQRANTLLAK